ncbi:unnamed protein product [Gongylonema pulchrum]|uniref:Secreted protein n=1 Tax=Gongylonema pulchrum TaxID=637853 RepID=A0A183DPU7_9BILA|nr:unnamed protein product [Gongylonema pulchrum]
MSDHQLVVVVTHSHSPSTCGLWCAAAGFLFSGMSTVMHSASPATMVQPVPCRIVMQYRTIEEGRPMQYRPTGTDTHFYSYAIVVLSKIDVTKRQTVDFTISLLH